MIQLFFIILGWIPLPVQESTTDLQWEHLGPVIYWTAQTNLGKRFLEECGKAELATNGHGYYVDPSQQSTIDRRAKEAGLKILVID